MPNINAAKGNLVSSIKNFLTPQMQTLVDYLKEHEEVSDEEVQALLGVKRTRAFNLTKQMSDAGLLIIVGRGKNRRLILNKP